MADQTQGAGAPGFSMTVTYDWDDGLLQIPVCGTRNDGSQKCALVRTHSPVGAKVVSWKIESVGKPKVPSPEDVSPGSTFLRSTLPIMTPVVDANGNFFLWRLAGVYFYALDTPHGIEQPFAIGKQAGLQGVGPQLTPDMFSTEITNG